MAQDQPRARQIQAPLSIGELIDKITILEIKSERMADPKKLLNVRHELAVLNGIKTAAGLETPEMAAYATVLRAINGALWDIEDRVRELEAKQDFGGRFVELARSVYLTNDKRARVKQQINAAFNSAIVEEKSYRGA